MPETQLPAITNCFIPSRKKIRLEDVWNNVVLTIEQPVMPADSLDKVKDHVTLG